MKDFKVLNLSIPSLDSSECKSLMGGDGYDIDGGNLFDFDIVVTSNRPDSPDYDEDLLRDSLDEDQGDNDFSHEHDDNQDNGNSKFNIDNMLQQAQPQVGTACVFAAISALLCGFGETNQLGWFNIAIDYARNNNINLESIIDGSFNGVDFKDIPELLGEYFSGVSSVDMNGLSDALNNGPVYGIMNPGDTDGNGVNDDGHAVVIFGYDEDHGTVYYWDPETGQTCNGAVGDFILGWTVTGVK